MEIHLIVLGLALLLDRFIGDPDWLWRRLPHPIVLFGKTIGWGEKRFNQSTQSPNELKKRGALLILALVVATFLIGSLIDWMLPQLGHIGAVLEVVFVAVFLAQKSLADHVIAVADGLRHDGVAGGRKAVSMIVGRDPQQLDEAGISRAAIESLAENASDGVVAPAFWFLLLGIPGLLAYKLINTADSMIGHRSERYLYFGWFAARLDDAVNWIPARLTAVFYAMASGLSDHLPSMRQVWDLTRRDAMLHRSPNAGWPETACAAALNLSLGGPRQYGAEFVNAPMLHAEGRRDANLQDIDRALLLYWKAMAVMTALIIAAALLGSII